MAKKDFPEAEKPNTFLSLKIKEFRAFLSMRFFFTFAYQMQAVIIGFHIYKLTNDPLALGFVGLCEAIPAIGIALYGGYIADKTEKRGLLIKVFFGVLFCSTVMLLITSNYMFKQGFGDYVVPTMYAMVFGIGLARGFFSPTTFSIMAQIVPREMFANATTWSSSSWQFASIIGPAIGGLIYGFFGITITYFVIVFFLLVALLCIFSLKKHEPTFVPTTNIITSLSEGIRFRF